MEGNMRFCFKLALILCCILWPTSADVGDFQPIVEYSLPADIMRVEFADETWIYRLYEDGTVKKVTSKGRYAATRSGRESELQCTDAYARWCDSESPRGHTYVDRWVPGSHLKQMKRDIIT